MMRIQICLFLLMLGLATNPAQACRVPPPPLQPPHTDAPTLYDKLSAAPDSYSDMMEAYARASEQCYAGDYGVLTLQAVAQAARDLHEVIIATRAYAEAQVRGTQAETELAFEKLLASDLWGHMEALRVAAAYGDAWAHLALAVRAVSAEARQQGLKLATQKFASLSLEFRHPLIVQRAIYGLAVAHIEAGRVDAANNALHNLRTSLAQSGEDSETQDFIKQVDGLLARLGAQDFTPPQPQQPPPATAPRDAQDSTPDTWDTLLARAEHDLRALRNPQIIAAHFAPIFKEGIDVGRGGQAAQQAALAFLSRDAALLAAASYEPAQSLVAMATAFEQQNYGRVQALWQTIAAYQNVLPPSLATEAHYQMGVALTQMNTQNNRAKNVEAAITHLQTAHKTAIGEQKAHILPFLHLAQFTRAASADTPPDAAILKLARQYDTIAPPQEGTALSLAQLLGLRARIVRATYAASQKNWHQADALLSGFGPQWSAYPLMLGMRVRLQARALEAVPQDSGQWGASPPSPAAVSRAKGGIALYRLWYQAISDGSCATPCLTGDVLSVHRAAIQIAIAARLPSEAFGVAWAAYEAHKGDTRPLTRAALAYLLAMNDRARLLAMLEVPDANLAAHRLGHWKKTLAHALADNQAADHYAFLRGDFVSALQGRPRAALLEALIDYELHNVSGATYFNTAQLNAAQLHSEILVRDFPRRPSAWFYRAEVLRQGARYMEAARLLSGLVRRTPPDNAAGIGARLGLVLLLADMQQSDKACALLTKMNARPQTAQHTEAASAAFALVGRWQTQSRALCPNKL